MAKRKIDQWHRHELMDRASLALEFFVENVERHPATSASPKLVKLANKAMDALNDFYQAAGVEFTKHEKD